MLALKNTPLTIRPRERLMSQTCPTLSLEDLLAVLIRTGTKKSDVFSVSNQVAQSLLMGWNSVNQLSSISGMGVTKASAIMAALQLGPALQQRKGSFCLSDPQKIYASCQDLIEYPQEHLVVFYLTVRNQQIARETVTIGTATASLVHPREVFRPAILHNASHVVLAHNHPSGVPSPSQADKQATIQMVKAGQNLGIEVVDHVIVATSGFVSLKSDLPELFF